MSLFVGEGEMYGCEREGKEFSKVTIYQYPKIYFSDVQRSLQDVYKGGGMMFHCVALKLLVKRKRKSSDLWVKVGLF